MFNRAASWPTLEISQHKFHRGKLGGCQFGRFKVSNETFAPPRPSLLSDSNFHDQCKDHVHIQSIESFRQSKTELFEEYTCTLHGFKVKIWGIRSIFLTWGLPLDRLRSFEGKNHPLQEKKMLKLISEFTTNIEAFKQPKKSPSASFFFQLYSNHKNFFNQTTQVTLATRKPNASRIIKA